MAGHVTELGPGGRIDPSLWFDGPWESIERVTIDTDQSVDFVQDESEIALYVIGGAGYLTRTDSVLPIRTGSAITCLKDSHVTAAADEPLDLLVVRLRT